MTERIQDKIIKMPLPTHKKPQKSGVSQTSRLVVESKSISVKHFESVLADMLDTVDDALFSSAEKAENNQIQTLYFDAMREMRIIRSKLENSFINAISDKFNVLTDEMSATSSMNKSVNPSGNLEAVGLVDTDTLEQDLAISTMICKIRHQCKEPLFSLEKRIGFLISEPDLQEADNPVGPESICQAFKNSTEIIETGIEIRLLVFKLFDQHVANTMHALYTKLNDYLIQSGILRDLDPYKCNYNRQQIPERYLNSPQPAEIQHQTTQDHARNNPGDFASNTYNHPGSNPPAYIASLTNLQHDVAPQASYENTTGIESTAASSSRNLLYNIKESGIGAQLGDNGNIILDIVAMLFDYILDDPHTPDSMRALIGRLQIPVLKVAIIDRTFFSKKSHPARQLLNQLSSIAVGFDDDTDNSDPLFAKVESIVQTILESFDEDISLFSALLDDFISFKENEQANTEKRAMKTVQLVEGQEKVEVAKGAANAETVQRMNDCPNIQMVSEFIKKHWKNLLFLIYARDGKDSETWKDAITTMDDLVWSVKPKETEEDRHKLLLLQPGLIERLRSGMERLSVPGYERDHFIAELTKLQGRTALNKPTQSDETDISHYEEEAEVKTMPVEVPASVNEAPEIEDKYHDAAIAIEVGTWVKFRSNQAASVRAKCSWISPMTGTLLFTDRTGRKIESLSQLEFANRLRTMQALLIDDTPVLDRAVECTMNKTEAS